MYYRILPVARLGIFTTSSADALNATLVPAKDQELWTTSVPASQFLCERGLAASGHVMTAVPMSTVQASAVPSAGTFGMPLAGTASGLAPSPTLYRKGSPEFEQRRGELEQRSGGDHDVPYYFSLQLQLPHPHDRVELWERVQRGDLQAEVRGEECGTPRRVRRGQTMIIVYPVSTWVTYVARKVSEAIMFNKQQHDNSDPQGAASTALAPLSQQECAEMLAHIPLFCELSPRQLRKLAGAAVQRTYLAGTVIVRQGEPGVGLYVIIRGRARVQQQSADDSPRQLALLGGNEIFGELALLDNAPRSATVVAEEDTSSLVIPIFDFRALLHDDVDIAIKLLAVLARRVRTAESMPSF